VSEQVGVVWVGHRGYPEVYPENSLLGIAKALELGARAIEIDLQASLEGEPVMFHDEELFRVTGNVGAVCDYPIEKLRSFSAHEPQRFGKQHYPCPIAHLAEVVELLRLYPGVRLFVELKAEVFQEVPRRVFLHKVWQILQPIHQDCVLISFDLYILRLAQEQFGCPVGWVLTLYDHQSYARIRDKPVDYVICNVRKLPSLPESLWSGPWEWFVYDVVDEALARTCAQRGIRWIETWNIGAMLKLEVQTA
jgi:glycerophosphoryl diester phosphodiesterase